MVIVSAPCASTSALGHLQTSEPRSLQSALCHEKTFAAPIPSCDPLQPCDPPSGFPLLRDELRRVCSRSPGSVSLRPVPSWRGDDRPKQPNVGGSGHCCPSSMSVLKNTASSRTFVLGHPDTLARCWSQDLTWIRLGISVSLSAGTQSGTPAFRAPLTNSSASLSA